LRDLGGLSETSVVIDWGMIEVLLYLGGALIFGWFLRFWTRAMTTNHFDNPVYKKNVRDLIERNKRFEDSQE
jgi:hypothetical protein